MDCSAFQPPLSPLYTSHSCEFPQQHPLHVDTSFEAKKNLQIYVIFWGNGPLKVIDRMLKHLNLQTNPLKIFSCFISLYVYVGVIVFIQNGKISNIKCKKKIHAFLFEKKFPPWHTENRFTRKCHPLASSG